MVVGVGGAVSDHRVPIDEERGVISF
jgi:hypothetical protein